MDGFEPSPKQCGALFRFQTSDRHIRIDSWKRKTKKKEKQQHEPWRYNNVIALGIFSLWCYLKKKKKKKKKIQDQHPTGRAYSINFIRSTEGWFEWSSVVALHVWLYISPLADVNRLLSGAWWTRPKISSHLQNCGKIFWNFFFEAIKCDCSWLLN